MSSTLFVSALVAAACVVVCLAVITPELSWSWWAYCKYVQGYGTFDMLVERFFVAHGLFMPFALHIICTVSFYYAYLFWLTCGFDIAYAKSLWVNRTAKRPIVDANELRKAFSDTSLPTKGISVNHTHGYAAAKRTVASTFCELVATKIGAIPWMLQMSASDQRHELMGSRTYFWSKDLDTRPCKDAFPDNGICVAIDVDMYLDMPHVLCEDPRSWLIYTLSPTRAAFASDKPEDGELKFRFNADQSLTYIVAGGAVYEHFVWNYRSDTLVVSRGGFWGWVAPRTVHYKVEQRRLDPLRAVVCLAMTQYHTGFAAFVSRLFAGGTLARLAPVSNGWATIDFYENGWQRSLAKLGDFTSVEIPQRSWDTLSSVSRTSAHPITIGQAESFANLSKDTAARVVEMLRTNATPNPPIVVAVEHGVRAYEIAPKDRLTMDPNVPMVAFMSPLLHEGFVPVRTRNHSEISIFTRVEKLQAGSLKDATTAQVNMMREFVMAFLGKYYQSLFPVMEEEVYARQKRPTQRRILESGQLGAKPGIQAFQKVESYGGVKDPRNISTIDAGTKLRYSAYIYALADVLKEMPCYAFGKTPVDIATAVAAICSKAQVVLEVDAARMDGRVSVIARTLELMVIAFAFVKNDAIECADLHKNVVAQRGVTTEGVKYEQGPSRASGEPGTSVFNTILTMFMFYVAYRYKLAPHEAFESLLTKTISGGDDGTASDIDPEHVSRAYSSVNQLAEIIIHKRGGGSNVMFLARVYSPYAWYGDNSSCCDVPRSLSKLHLSQPLPPGTAPLDKFAQKMIAYALGDANTPILGDLAAAARTMKVITKIEPLDPDLLKQNGNDIMWWAQYAQDVQWPNVNVGDWMHDYVSRVLPDVDLAAVRRVFASIVKGGDPQAFLRMPLIQLPKPAVASADAFVDGVFLDAKNPVVRTPVPPVNKETAAKLAAVKADLGLEKTDKKKPNKKPRAKRGAGGQKAQPSVVESGAIVTAPKEGTVKVPAAIVNSDGSTTAVGGPTTTTAGQQ